MTITQNLGLPITPGEGRKERERDGFEAFTAQQLVDLHGRLTAVEGVLVLAGIAERDEAGRLQPGKGT